MKYLIIFLIVFLPACSTNQNQYDYYLRENDVYCVDLKKEERSVTLRLSTTKYIYKTSKCFFLKTEQIDINRYNEKEKLKNLAIE